MSTLINYLRFLFTPTSSIKRVHFILLMLLSCITLAIISITSEYNETLMELVSIFFIYISVCLFVNRFRDIGISMLWLFVYLAIMIVIAIKLGHSLLMLQYFAAVILLSILPTKGDMLVSYKKINHYISKHWRGRCSLVVSYWLNIILLNIAYNALFRIFIAAIVVVVITSDSKMDNQYLIKTLQIVTALSLLTGNILFTWQVVGCWRSANLHKNQTKKYFWATLSQISLVFYMLIYAVVIDIIKDPTELI
jgi:uncharacterized membrane protein YhaH (DUF805 family)